MQLPQVTQRALVVLQLFALAVALLPRAVGAQGNPLGPEFRVNTYTSYFQVTPSVSASAAGDFVVLWSSQQDGWSFGVFGQRYDAAGNPMGPEFRVNTYTTNTQIAPAADFDSFGNFVIAWQSDQDGSYEGVYAQRYTASGVPVGPEFRVNTFTTGIQGIPNVSADPSGNFVVVWMSFGQDGSSGGVFAQRYAASGTPLGGEFRVNTFTTGEQNSPDVGGDASGNFVVVWGTPFNGVFGQRYASSGAPLGPEFRVDTQGGGSLPSPSVASAAAGGFVVTWASYDSDGRGVFGQRYANTGAPLGSEFRVNSYTTSHQHPASVAADPAGNFVVVWGSRDQDGSLYGVFGQRFDSGGTPLGPEFQVNTYTTLEQWFPPSVAADGAGNFMVAWESNGQDGSDQGVFGQRYAPILPVELMHFNLE